MPDFIKTIPYPKSLVLPTKLNPLLYLGQELIPAGILKSHSDVPMNNEFYLLWQFFS
jgi:hypothetical protein